MNADVYHVIVGMLSLYVYIYTYYPCLPHDFSENFRQRGFPCQSFEYNPVSVSFTQIRQYHPKAVDTRRLL